MERTDITDLIGAARSGDARAWEDLVERFLPLVGATIARLGLRGAESDDVNQAVWLRLVEHLDQIREPRALPGWIVTTTRHECLKTFDKGRRSVSVDPHTSAVLDRVDDEHEVSDRLLADEREHALRVALAELPADRRELLLLLCADPPLAYAEISRHLGIPVGSIGPTRARALAALRKTRALREFLDGSTIKGGEHDVSR